MVAYLQLGKTPFHYAAEKGKDQSCKLLLEAGVSVDIQDEVSLPLGDVEVRDLLLKFVIEMLIFNFKSLPEAKLSFADLKQQFLAGFFVSNTTPITYVSLSLSLSLSLSPPQFVSYNSWFAELFDNLKCFTRMWHCVHEHRLLCIILVFQLMTVNSDSDSQLRLTIETSRETWSCAKILCVQSWCWRFTLN